MALLFILSIQIFNVQVLGTLYALARLRYLKESMEHLIVFNVGNVESLCTRRFSKEHSTTLDTGLGAHCLTRGGV